MQHESARLKGERAPGDLPVSQPMRATRQGEIRRNPSTDQKKVRRALPRREATILETRAEMLNPGDMVSGPTGRTMKVTRVRPHETDPLHVYVDTDGGTALVKRTDSFQIRPHNSQQNSLPGYGTPGGNSNTLPFDPQTNRAGPGNTAQTGKCPICRTGTLVRRGDHYVCNQCGYQEQFGGAGGHSYSDAPSRTFSTINASPKSAIARRAQSVLDQKETP